MVAENTETAAVSTEDLSVFAAPNTDTITVIEAAWRDLTITPVGVKAERIRIPVIYDAASREEGERVLHQIEALEPLVAADHVAAMDLAEIIADLLDDMAWFDSGDDADLSDDVPTA